MRFTTACVRPVAAPKLHSHLSLQRSLTRTPVRRLPASIIRAEKTEEASGSPKDETPPTPPPAEEEKSTTPTAEAENPAPVAEAETPPPPDTGLKPPERTPLSEDMKTRMRDEYIGLGGAENSKMGQNWFLYIIVIISALAVASYLTGSI